LKHEISNFKLADGGGGKFEKLSYEKKAWKFKSSQVIFLQVLKRDKFP